MSNEDKYTVSRVDYRISIGLDTLADTTVPPRQWIEYLSRHTSELSLLRQERRKGRPPVKREEALTQLEEAEAKEYSTGFWMPDLGSEDNLRRIKEWNGEWSSMSTVDFVRLSSSGNKQKSMFPPKGLS
ncbi:translation machinery-associated protein 16 [Emydomyces testavorans]|uniref:Translation machinery-associated protein 16 n=1 Tax=Emydomyces testavorans TaxID=2070801 RepID=A0AAF0DJZ3_9EURO|nr:translation machinery-associated protein 16 [Emydomyces testavorans]